VVDEKLKQVFKEAGAEVIYGYLEKLLSSAKPVIEKMILKNLYCKLELKFVEKEGYEFSDYIKELREKYDVKGYGYAKSSRRRLDGRGWRDSCAKLSNL